MIKFGQNDFIKLHQKFYRGIVKFQLVDKLRGIHQICRKTTFQFPEDANADKFIVPGYSKAFKF